MGAGPLLIPHSHTLSTASRNCLVAVISCYAQHVQDQKQHLQPAEYSSKGRACRILLDTTLAEVADDEGSDELAPPHRVRRRPLVKSAAAKHSY